MRFRGQNPVYRYGRYNERSYSSTESATYGGVVTKTAILLGIVASVALYFAYTLKIESIGNIIPILIGAPIIAIIAMITAHVSPRIAPVASIVYAIAEGVLLGFISGIVAYAYDGELVQMALIGTFGVLFGMLFLYSTGIIRVGRFFRRAMFSMVMGLILSSIILMILAFSGSTIFYDFYVLIVVLSVVISSLYLLVDFDNITHYVEAEVSKDFEWSLSLGLVATIVWVYIEILRLLIIIAGRRD